ncbi:sulfite exporter TauE/SafE family protein [Salinibacter altiplanensis]|uniref:sulfite exporter TauE/SafE family protein n=1 Tax=Salinibacter altiplanensis TaxID=1803181 RepID=UPI000C9F5682|nr:sulfite exporter TauE/SafE family protein [Salinibacter altiplanensis]
MYAAWIGALLVGLVLGLLGSGGSILTVPVLVYLVGEPNKLAIAESLGIVTLISLVGALPFAYKGQVNWRSVGLFGGPGMVGAYLGAYLSKFMPGTFQLAIFAAVMLLAAVMMFRRTVPEPGEAETRRYWKVMLDGLGVGILTGLVGVGGGFLIVPALVLLGGLPMHLAIGTSLCIIALKSISGFVKYIDVLGQAGFSIHWDLVLIFSAIGIVGSFIGGKVGSHVPQARLKRGFAVFLVLMGVAMLGQNVMEMVG